MRRRFTSACVIAVAALSTSATAAHAQRVLGTGDDALVLPRGAFRVRVVQNFTDFNERYGFNTPGRRNGSLEPLGVDFNLDTVGLVQFPALRPVQDGLRSLTGMNSFNVSLGATRLRADVRISATPVVAVDNDPLAVEPGSKSAGNARGGGCWRFKISSST